MPQLDMSTWPPQLIWLAISFGLLYFVVSKFIIPGTGAVIEQRKNTIDGDLAAAQKLKADAESTLKAYEAALEDARSKSNQLSAENRARVQADTDAALARVNGDLKNRIAAAESSIAAAKARAMDNIETVAADLSSSIVGELIGGRAR